MWLTEALKYLVHPTDAFPAGRALAARLVLVERHETSDGLNYVRLFVHNDKSSGTESRLHGYQAIEIHDGIVANTEINLLVNNLTDKMFDSSWCVQTNEIIRDASSNYYYLLLWYNGCRRATWDNS